MGVKGGIKTWVPSHTWPFTELGKESDLATYFAHRSLHKPTCKHSIFNIVS